MAINPLSVPNFGGPYSGGADFAPLGNLGNVMQAQQDRQRQLSALGQLGTDPTQNAMTLIKSNDPRLAQTGLELMQNLTRQKYLESQQAESIRQFQAEQGVRESAEKRAQAEFEASDPDARQAAWVKSHPGEDVNSPQAQAYIWKQPQLLTANRETSQDRTAIRQADDQVNAAHAALKSLDRMEELRQKAIHTPFGESGTEAIGYGLSFLPEGMGGTAGAATEELKNETLNTMMDRVKAAFGSNPSNKEDAWMREAQASVGKSSTVQKDIIKRGKEIMEERLKQNMDRATEMRGGTFYKPGGGVTKPPPPPPPDATGETTTPPKSTPTSETSLPSSDWMTRARKANPGMSDSELVSNWKKKHPHG